MSNPNSLDVGAPFGQGDTSFKAAGGRSGIRQLVDAFYDQMELDDDPNVVAIRAMHGLDLSLSRTKLAVFLNGWLGGPREYAQQFGQISIPGFHARFNIQGPHRDAWLKCMAAAIKQQNYSAEFADYLITQLSVPAQRVVQTAAAYKAAQENNA